MPAERRTRVPERTRRRRERQAGEVREEAERAQFETLTAEWDRLSTEQLRELIAELDKRKKVKVYEDMLRRVKAQTEPCGVFTSRLLDERMYSRQASNYHRIVVEGSAGVELIRKVAAEKLKLAEQARKMPKDAWAKLKTNAFKLFSQSTLLPTSGSVWDRILYSINSHIFFPKQRFMDSRIGARYSKYAIGRASNLWETRTRNLLIDYESNPNMTTDNFGDRLKQINTDLFRKFPGLRRNAEHLAEVVNAGTEITEGAVTPWGAEEGRAAAEQAERQEYERQRKMFEQQQAQGQQPAEAEQQEEGEDRQEQAA